MKNLGLLLLTAIAAVALGGCAPAENTNTATTAATPAKPAAPTKEALFEMDKKANEAWIKGDKAYFEGMLSDKFVGYERGERTDKTGILGMIGAFKCDMKTWSLEDPQMSMVDADTYVMSYKGNFDGSCTGPDGKSMKMPSPVRAASLWVRSGDTWKGAGHFETPIIEPKGAAVAKADAKPAAGIPKPGNPAAAEIAESTAEDDKAAAAEKSTEAKKPDAAKPAGKADPKAAPNSNTNTADAKKALAPSANTAALVALHTAGWEAFKNKDAKKFDELLANNFAFVDPIGGWHSGKADAIKLWTGGGDMKCEGVTTTSVKDGVATALSPTVEILTLVGTANGTCDGQKNGPVYQTAVYVKEGAAWKLAFMFESPAK